MARIGKNYNIKEVISAEKKVKIPIPTEEALEFKRRGLLEPDLEEGG